MLQCIRKCGIRSYIRKKFPDGLDCACTRVEKKTQEALENIRKENKDTINSLSDEGIRQVVRKAVKK